VRLTPCSANNAFGQAEVANANVGSLAKSRDDARVRLTAPTVPIVSFLLRIRSFAATTAIVAIAYSAVAEPSSPEGIRRARIRVILWFIGSPMFSVVATSGTSVTPDRPSERPVAASVHSPRLGRSGTPSHARHGRGDHRDDSAVASLKASSDIEREPVEMYAAVASKS